jgi:hypothetical protein
MYRLDTSKRYVAFGPLASPHFAAAAVDSAETPADLVIFPSSAAWSYAADVWSRRLIVEYGLARRAALAELQSGHLTMADACDAHPYLLRAAKYHGEPTDERCPVCRREKLTHVTYVYGDELGRYAGRIKTTDELAEMAQEYGEFRVYVVEVCQSCAWNHLTVSYVLGHGEHPAASGDEPR